MTTAQVIGNLISVTSVTRDVLSVVVAFGKCERLGNFLIDLAGERMAKDRE